MFLTVDPRWHDLEGVDQLRIEPGRQLDTHARREQHHVEESQVGLPPPWDLVLLQQAGDDGVGRPRLCLVRTFLRLGHGEPMSSFVTLGTLRCPFPGILPGEGI